MGLLAIATPDRLLAPSGQLGQLTGPEGQLAPLARLRGSVEGLVALAQRLPERGRRAG